MRRRKPQPRCKCGHAKSQHAKRYMAEIGIDFHRACGFCWDECLEFKQDNLATLERLNAFKEETKEVIKDIPM